MIKKLWVICWVLIQGIGCFGEEFTLEQAIPMAFAYVRERIPDGSKVSIRGLTSEYQKAGAYIFEEWVALAVNDEALSVMDQPNTSGFTISGAFEVLGSSYILRIRLLEADTEQILAQGRFDIVRSPLLTSLLGYSEEAEKQEQPPKSDDSLPGALGDKWLVIGMGFPMIFNTMTGEPLIKSYGYKNYQEPSPFGLGFNLMISVQLFKYFALQTDITYNWNSLSDEFWGSFDDSRLQTTLLVKLTLDLWGLLGIEPFAGVYVDFPLGSLSYMLGKENRYSEYLTADSTAYSIQPGFVAGLRMYTWFFFTDYRFGVDFTPTSVDNYHGQSGDLYRRRFFSITLGIQWGFLKKKR